MTSQTFLLEDPYLVNFITNFINLNYTSFFLGLQLGLDHNWDSLDILFSDTFMPIYSNKKLYFV